MITSGLQGIQLPEPSDPDNVPYHLGLAVGQLESRGVMRFISEAARDSAIMSPVEGMVAAVQGVGPTYYDGTQWLLWLARKPRVMVLQNSPQANVPHLGWFNVTFDGTEPTDPAGLHGAGARVYIGARPGWWRVSGTVVFGNGSGSTRRAAIALNDARIAGSFRSQAAHGLDAVGTQEVLVRATTGTDNVTLQCYHDAAGDLDLAVSAEARSSLVATWIEPA